MAAVFLWLFRGLLYLLSFFFSGIVKFFMWSATSSVGFFITFGSSLFIVFLVCINSLEDIILKFFPIIPTDDYSFSFGASFADLLDYGIITLLGNDPFSAVLRDVLYIVSLGGLVNSFINFCLPFLLTCWSYKFIKSWLPTLGA